MMLGLVSNKFHALHLKEVVKVVERAGRGVMLLSDKLTYGPRLAYLPQRGIDLLLIYPPFPPEQPS